MQMFKIKRKRIDKDICNLTNLVLLIFVREILFLY